MYATPIIYPMSALPEKYRMIVLLNPISGIVETFRYTLLGKGIFDPVMLLYSSIATFVILVIGLLIFNRVEKNFMDIV
jgi:lipopolysaccharide transport system permease protein